MYGIYKNQVAINNVLPGYRDGQLQMQDETWGWGATLGMLYEFDARPAWASRGTRRSTSTSTRRRSSRTSRRAFTTCCAQRGLLDSSVAVGIKVPQQLMGSVYTEVERPVGGARQRRLAAVVEVRPGRSRTRRPTQSDQRHEEPRVQGHVARGSGRAVPVLANPGCVNFGMAYDSRFQSGNRVAAAAGQRRVALRRGRAAAAVEERLLGLRGRIPLRRHARHQPDIRHAGRGSVAAAISSGRTTTPASLFFSAYYNWRF